MCSSDLKKVLRDCLKVATEAHFLISRGQSFHNLGTWFIKQVFFICDPHGQESQLAGGTNWLQFTYKLD